MHGPLSIFSYFLYTLLWGAKNAGQENEKSNARMENTGREMAVENACGTAGQCEIANVRSENAGLGIKIREQ